MVIFFCLHLFLSSINPLLLTRTLISYISSRIRVASSSSKPVFNHLFFFYCPSWLTNTSERMKHIVRTFLNVIAFFIFILFVYLLFWPNCLQASSPFIHKKLLYNFLSDIIFLILSVNNKCIFYFFFLGSVRWRTGIRSWKSSL